MPRRPRFSFAACLMILLFAAGVSTAAPDDHIFPPGPDAAASVSFDGKGFIINGKREFIASGSVHMGRLPRAQWHNIFCKLKAAGFNTVQTYVFWNYFEPQKDQIDFTGEKDLGAFLQAAQDVGLYATVRVGPYVCAEWDSGGYPIWLRFIPDLQVRVPNAAFEKEVDSFFDKLLPIVAAHQIYKGGNVILVQLENEHPKGWGTAIPNEYFQHLLDKARAAGIEVPTFFSGLHHGFDPLGAKPIDNSKRTNPWYSTETWVQWFDKYGDPNAAGLAKCEQVGWNFAAHGANGYNLYMIFGGTNFDFFNDDEDTSSYDYGTLIGQTGDLRTLYYRFKRINYLAASFPEVFADGVNASSQYADFAKGVAVTARQGSSGTIVFLENNSAQARPRGRNSSATRPAVLKGPAILNDGTSISVDAGEMTPVLVDMTLAPGIKAHLAATNTLALSSNGTMTTWVIYGAAGDKGLLDLLFDADAKASGSAGFDASMTDPKHLIAHVEYANDAPRECVVTSGGQTLRILAMTSDWADRTWIVGPHDSQNVVVGPQYVEDYSNKDDAISMTIERPFGNAAPAEVSVYGHALEPASLKVSSDNSADDAATPALGSWQVSVQDRSAPDLDDSKWFASNDAPQMGSDGDVSAYAWYRASFDAKSQGAATLHFAKIADSALVFLNGKRIAALGKKNSDVPTELVAGHNTLAVFVSHHGRQKAYNYMGPMITYEPKGIVGAVTVEQDGATSPITGWKLRGGVGQPDADSLKWATVASDDQGAPAFFRTHFTGIAAGQTGPVPIYRITTDGLSSGSVFLNGHNLGRYPEILKGVDGIYLPDCWINAGDNTLVLFDEKGLAPTRVKIVCEKIASREVIEVTGKSGG